MWWKIILKTYIKTYGNKFYYLKNVEQ
jgi:hypothetical protein